MPIKPRGSKLYFNASGIVTQGATLIVDSCEYTYDVEFFDRNEYDHVRLMNAPNADGSLPIFIDMYSGQKLQWLSSCGSYNTVREVTPDDSDIDNIKRRWDIRRYKISGDVTDDFNVSLIFNASIFHQILLNQLAAHFAIVQMPISYQELITLQSDTIFNSIANTNVGVFGDCISPIGSVTAISYADSITFDTNCAAGLLPSQLMIVNPFQTTAEIVEISSIADNTVTLVNPLQYTHQIGERVQLYENNMLITDYTPAVERVIPTASGGFTVRKLWSLTLENRVNQPARSSTA